LTGANAKDQTPLRRKTRPFLSMARDEHTLKMKVLKLKEWRLMNQGNNMGIGLPPAYDFVNQPVV